MAAAALSHPAVLYTAGPRQRGSKQAKRSNASRRVGSRESTRRALGCGAARRHRRGGVASPRCRRVVAASSRRRRGVVASPRPTRPAGGWCFFVAENAVLSENRAWFIERVGERAYRGCYGLCSTASLASVGYFGRAEILPVGLGFAMAFKRTAPAVQRCKSQQQRCSYEIGRHHRCRRIRIRSSATGRAPRASGPAAGTYWSRRRRPSRASRCTGRCGKRAKIQTRSPRASRR